MVKTNPPSAPLYLDTLIIPTDLEAAEMNII